MPYVQRDASGRISAIFQKPEQHAGEYLPHDHPDIQHFLHGILPQNAQNKVAAQLSESDLSLIRVIEDLVDTLIDKNVIMFTDLPVEAREKIMRRKSTRERLLGDSSFIEDEDRIF